jgi:hypothetical protein
MGKLKEVITTINQDIDTIMNDKTILPGYGKSIGKYLHKDIKREEISLKYAYEGLLLFEHEYFTSTINANLDKINFEESKANYQKKKEEETQPEPDESQNILSDNIFLVNDIKTRSHYAKEIYSKNHIGFVEGKVLVYQNPSHVDNPRSTLKNFYLNNSKKKLLKIISYKRKRKYLRKDNESIRKRRQ